MWLAQDRGVDLARLGQAPVDPIEQIQAQARQQVEQARQEEPQALYAQLQQAQEQQSGQRMSRSLSEQITKFAKGKNYWPQIENEIYAAANLAGNA
ncbi:MAG TPA: hypothetical protein VFJ59_00185 [Pseudolabrys sp.]|nr:hypothetical protein [Pseudolabrys sp.]